MTGAGKMKLYCKFLLTRRNIPFKGWFLGHDECNQPHRASSETIVGEPGGTCVAPPRRARCPCHGAGRRE
jgi:hypothetical protein